MKHVITALGLLFLVACTKSAPTSDATPTPSPSATPSASATPVASATPSQSVGCQVELAVASAAAQAVSQTLGCSGQDAINTDIQAAFGKANLCVTAQASVATLKAAQKKNKSITDVHMKGALGDVLCPILVDTLASSALKQVPSAWACGGSVTTQAVIDLITTTCKSKITF